MNVLKVTKSMYEINALNKFQLKRHLSDARPIFYSMACKMNENGEFGSYFIHVMKIDLVHFEMWRCSSLY